MDDQITIKVNAEGLDRQLEDSSRKVANFNKKAQVPQQTQQMETGGGMDTRIVGGVAIGQIITNAIMEMKNAIQPIVNILGTSILDKLNIMSANGKETIEAYKKTPVILQGILAKFTDLDNALRKQIGVKSADEQLQAIEASMRNAAANIPKTPGMTPTEYKKLILRQARPEAIQSIAAEQRTAEIMRSPELMQIANIQTRFASDDIVRKKASENFIKQFVQSGSTYGYQQPLITGGE